MRKKSISGNMKWAVFVIPALFFYILFFWVPFLNSVYYSFTDWNGVTANFIGLKNYIKLFHDPEILNAFGNSIFYTVAITLIQNVCGLILALTVKKNCLKNSISNVN